MKTTIDIPDDLARQAKELARKDGSTLRDLVVGGLRHEVERRMTAQPIADFNFTTYDGGWLLPGVTSASMVELSYEDTP